MAASTPHPIPLVYRLTFNYFEPMAATLGALQLHTTPTMYLSIANPNITAYYHSSLQPLFTQILGGWLILAFNDAVTLRVYSHDLRLWRLILSAHLISDLVYSYAICQDLGAARFWNPTMWTGGDWLTVGTTLPPLLLKVAFVLGIGVDFVGNEGKQRASKRK